MPYPWASFGAFVFQPEEVALDGVGGSWNYDPHESRMAAVGGISDSVQTISIGSAVRQFDCYLSPARVVELRGYVGQTALFTDWARPLPDSRSARLDTVGQGEFVASQNLDVPGGTDRRVKTTIRLSTQ